MRKPLFFFLPIILCWVDFSHASGNSQRPGLDVSIEAVEPQFVLGEIVRLNVKIRNVEQKAVSAWELINCSELGTWISSDGRDYKAYNLGLGIYAAEREVINLLPGESLMYQVEILTSIGPDAKFAFRDGPGPFWIKARYNLTRPKLPNYSYDTEPIQIRITPPLGEDEEVLARIQDVPFLQYLQFVAISPERQDLPVKALELLEKYPNCAYHIDLRSRILQSYLSRQFRTQGKTWQSELLARAEKVLGTNSQAFYSDRTLPHDDLRLNRMVHYEYSNTSALQQALDEFTREGGVPLKLHDSLKQSRFPGGSNTVALRQFMQSVVEPGRTIWVRSGHAYILQPVEGNRSP
jgi:hypothetical protein